MRYDFTCNNCSHTWEETQGIQFRDAPLTLPCPSCKEKGSIKRLIRTLGISYEGNKTVLQRAGSGWNDVLNKVKKASGRINSIQTR
jgi:predicted nucleic acid-binding Zn ribbon protein